MNQPVMDHWVLVGVLALCTYSFLHAVKRMLAMGNSHNKLWGFCYFLIGAAMACFFMNILGYQLSYMPYAVHTLIAGVALYMWLTRDVWKDAPPGLTENENSDGRD